MHKKILLKTLCIICVLASSFTAHATHVMGGDMSYTYVSLNTYTITLTLYRDCAGIALSNCYQVEIYSPSHGNYLQVLTLNQVNSAQEVTPVGSNCNYISTCSGGTDPGVEQGVYSGTISGLPAYTDLVIVFETAARNSAITNLNVTGGTTGMSILATLDNGAGINGSSPIFSSIPTAYICPGTKEIFSQGAYDPNGDSLAFAQIAPYNGSQPNGGGGGGGCNSNAPYTIPFNFADTIPYINGLNSHNPLSLKAGTSLCFDPSTGQFSFTPGSSQVTVMAVQVKKLRKISGVWTVIGSVERDMQLYVVSGTLCNANHIPQLQTPTGVSGGTLTTTTSPCDGTNIYSFTVCAGTALKFTLPALDSDATQTLTAITNGATSLSGSTITVSNGTTANKKTINFSWSPSVLDEGSYLFTVTLTDNACSFYGRSVNTIRVYVEPVLSVVNKHDTICKGNSTVITAQGATSYSWTSSSSSTVTTGASLTVSPTVSTTYYVVSPVTTCKNLDTVYVVVAPKISITASATTVCSGAAVTLTGKNAKTYSWSPGGATTSSITINPTITTTYTLISKNLAGCNDTATIVINVNPLPVITIKVSKDTICVGASTTLTASGANTYTWQPGSLTGASVTVKPATNTNYVVTGTNTATGCTNKDSIVVLVNTLPVITASASTKLICAGTLDTLTASGALTYTWMPGGKSGTSVTVNPTANTTYTVTGTSKWGCVSTDTVQVKTKALPVLLITSLPTPAAICINSSITLTASGANTYIWSPGGVTTSSITVSPTITSIYKLSGTNTVTGCVNKDSITVTVYNLPTITATANPNPICKGKLTTLTGAGGVSYTWMPGNLAGTTISVSPTINTTYSITGTDAHGCVDTGSIKITVDTLPIITTTVSAATICDKNNTTINASGALTYNWMPGNYNGSSVIVSPTITTTYTATGTDIHGCKDTASVKVTVNPLPVIYYLSGDTICYGTSATLTPVGNTNSYTWLPGNLTDSIVTVNPTVTTTYTVTGVSAFGCKDTATVIVKVIPLPTIGLKISKDTICIGMTTTLTASGANTYTWMPGNLIGSSISVSPITNTNYVVTGTNTATGCANKDSLVVLVNALPVITASALHKLICSGTSDTLKASGANTYTWMPGSYTGASIIVNPTTNTTYSVTGTSKWGCTSAIDTVQVKTKALPVLTIAALPATAAICINASVTLTAGGANSYIWTPGGLSTASISVSPTNTTTYRLSGTSTTTGCVNKDSIIVTVYQLPTITATASAGTICDGKSTTLTGVGGSTYKWVPGNLTGTTVTVSPTVNTTYSITGTDVHGCVDTGSIKIKVDTLPVIKTTATPSSVCIGNKTTLTASGAVSYTWKPNNFTGSSVTFTPNVTTTYIATGTDGNGCISTGSVKITVNPLPVIYFTKGDTICNGASVTLTPTGSSTNTYTWQPGNLTDSVVTVKPTITTTYTVKGTSIFGCTDSAKVTIKVNPLPTITLAATVDSLCAGASVTLTAGGATTYAWTPGSLSGTAVTITPPTTTKYVVTGTNIATKCSNADSITIKVNQLPTIIATAAPSTICAGKTSTITASGAATYTWTPGSLTGATNNVSPTTTTRYLATGTNTHGCVDTASVLLTVNPLPVIYFTKGDTICYGDSVYLTPLGTSSTYKWNPGNYTGSSIGVHPTVTTTYTISGTSALGCTNNATITIKVNPLPTVTITPAIDSICAGASATLTAGGASTYTWAPGNVTTNTLLASPTATTTYTVTGVSTLGCKNKDSIKIKVNALPVITAKASHAAICLHKNDTLIGTGGGTYKWMPGSIATASTIVSPSITTTYILTVKNISGCAQTDTITITVDTLPRITTIAASTSICTGTSTTITAKGASTYKWLPGSGIIGSVITVNPTITTIYTVTGTDVNGCVNTDTASVKVKALPTISVTPKTDSVCSGFSALLSASGAKHYLWMPGGDTTSSLSVTPLSYTIYTVTGTSAINCSDTATVKVKVNALPQVVAGAAPAIICATGTSTLSASGGVRYLWQPGGDTTSSVTVSPNTTTTYTVTVTNASKCKQTSSNAVVTVNQLPVITATASSPAICVNNKDTLSVTAGGVPATYSWSPGGLTNSTIIVSPKVTTSYIVTGTNTATGCVNKDTVNVNVDTLPIIKISATSAAICIKKYDTLTAKGATTYTWTPGNLTENPYIVNPSVTTTYTAVGINANGCSGSAQTTVTVNKLPVITAIAAHAAICHFKYDTLIATANTTVNYVWSPGNATTSSISVNPATTTRYTVTATDVNHCIDTVSISIKVNPLPQITASATSTNLCRNNIDTLSATGALVYVWQPGNINGSPVYVTPQANLIYTVIGTDVNMCSDTVSVSVTVLPLPAVSVTATSVAFCAGDSATIKATGALSYIWQPGGMSNATDTIRVVPAASTRYIVSGLGTNGCSDTAGVFILVHPLPPVKDTAVPAYICIGQTSTLTAKGARLYVWEPGNSNGSVLSVKPNTTTRYSVTGYDQYGCHDTASFLLGVNQTPAVNSRYDTTIYSSYSTPIHASNPNSPYYVWAPDSFINHDTGVYSPISTPTKSILYTVQLNNFNNCPIVDTFIVTVKPDCVGVFVPTAFSPNGDGVNDQLQLIVLHDDNIENFEIYDRWGNKVFQTNDPNQSWDGNYKGQPEPIAAYVYFIRYRCKEGTIVQKQGNITLLR